MALLGLLGDGTPDVDSFGLEILWLVLATSSLSTMVSKLETATLSVASLPKILFVVFSIAMLRLVPTV